MGKLFKVNLRYRMESVFKPTLFAGKYALVTGGATGINYTIALGYLKHGASVAIMSRNEANVKAAVEELRKTAGVPAERVFGTKCDVRDYQQCVTAVDQVLEKFGRIDILINGAAGNFLAQIEGLSSKGFRTVLEIDTIGTFNVSKVVYEKSMKKNGGNIINISATLHYTGTAMQSHVGAAKAGVDALTKHMAVEWGPKGVRVNGIAPGPIADTEGYRRLSTGDMARAQEFIPVQRLGLREDISNSCLFLASDAASYVTGQTLVVDGGNSFTVNNFTIFADDYRKTWRSKL
eukprot:TRINITY_DN10237_c0_g2_i5.p1 TRINITY_DN10237_c0_g2~~TRINITY_DN10237_c0_g2_i5.p1  ORF type:complete len:291 (-),score=78.90 TRINITY_DN10237_c0_g2_i5:769-1641(-)